MSRMRGFTVVALLALAVSAGASRALLSDDASPLTVANCKCGTKWVDLVIKYGFGDALGEEFRGTLFVPCDKAVAALPKMSEDKIKATIKYHIVVAESGPLEYLKKESPLQTFWKYGKLSVECGPDRVVGAKNSAKIIRGPEEVCVGATVVCIDTVLIPPPPPPKEEEKCYVEVPVPCSPVNVPHPSPCVEVECPKQIIWTPKPCEVEKPKVETCPSPKPSPPCPLPQGYALVSIWDIIEADPRMKLLAALCEEAGLKNKLKTMEKATMFAPTDEGIAKTLLWLGLKDYELFDNREVLKAILAYHIIPGVMLWHEEIACGTPHLFTMLKDRMLTMHAGKDCVGTHTEEDGEWWVVEGDLSVCNVVEPDIHGARVLVHACDFMLLPDEPCIRDIYYSKRQPEDKKTGCPSPWVTQQPAVTQECGPCSLCPTKPAEPTCNDHKEVECPCGH